MSSLRTQHDGLLKAFSATSPDLKSIGTQLTKLKIALTQAGLLIPNTGDAKARADDLVLTRDILEVGALWSIRVKDVKSFDRYVDLLRVFYNDLR